MTFQSEESFGSEEGDDGSGDAVASVIEEIYLEQLESLVEVSGNRVLPGESSNPRVVDFSSLESHFRKPDPAEVCLSECR